MKVLILLHPGTNSRGLLLDIAWGFERMGHEVFYFELQPYWGQWQEEPNAELRVKQALGKTLSLFIEQNNIDCSVGMWCNGSTSLPMIQRPDGSLQSYFDAIGHPHMHFWWDAPHWLNNGYVHPLFGTGFFAGGHQLHCINNTSTASEMSGILGFGNVAAVSNAVNPDSFFPMPEVPKEYDLVFFSGGGDPKPSAIMLEELLKDEPNMERIRLAEADRVRQGFDAILSSVDTALKCPMKRLLEGVLELRLANRHQPALLHLQEAVRQDRELAMAGAELTKQPLLYIRATDVLRSIEKWERPFLVAYLSRYFKCLRMGSQDYDPWGIQGDATGMVPYLDQAKHYARAKFALNVMRWQDDCSLNSKIFEITACRCVCLQSYRSGVEALFEEGREILSFYTPKEARDRLRQVLDTPGMSEEIAEAGYRRTLRCHTWAHRMNDVTKMLCSLTSTGAEAESKSHYPPMTLPVRASRITERGDHLAFVLCSIGSGEHLVRHVIRAHPMLAATVEDPLLDSLFGLWESCSSRESSGAQNKPTETGRWMKDEDRLSCIRSMTADTFNRMMPPAARWLLDDSALKRQCVDRLPELFPRAKFLVVVRDPRAMVQDVWNMSSRNDNNIDCIIEHIADQLHRQRSTLENHPDRSMMLRYEELCQLPESACRKVCEFFKVPFDRSMVQSCQWAYPESCDERAGGQREASFAEMIQLEPSVAAKILTQTQLQKLASACGRPLLEYFGFESMVQLIDRAVRRNSEIYVS